MRHVSHSILMFSGLLCGVVSAWADTTANPAAADVVSVSGTVLLRSGASDSSPAKMRTAKAGDPVYAQDIINTGSDGRIKVLLKDKSIIDLGPSALLKVDQFKGNNGAKDREVQVSMAYGTLRAAVTQKLEGKGKFKVRTPSATMGVRGTEFVVKSEIARPKTQVSVLQGKVDVGKRDFNASAFTAGRTPASAGVVSLTAGTQISTGTTGAALSAPKTMNSTQMKAIATEAKVVDTTFQKAVVIEKTSNGQGEGRSPASSGGGGSSPAVSSEAVHQVLASAEVPLPPPPQVRPSDMNIPGAAGPSQIFNQPAINTQGTLKRLRVVIVTQ